MHMLKECPTEASGSGVTVTGGRKGMRVKDTNATEQRDTKTYPGRTTYAFTG